MKTLQAFLVCIVLSISSIALSQSSEDTSKLKVAYPVSGYQALQDSIEYPMLLWKAGIESFLKVTVELDSIGTLLSVHFDHLMGKSFSRADSFFFPSISCAIESVKWSPGMLDNRPIGMQVSFPVLFFLTSNLEQTYGQIKRGETVIYRASGLTITHEKPYIHH